MFTAYAVCIQTQLLLPFQTLLLPWTNMDEKLNSLGDTKTCPVIFLEQNNKYLIGLRHYVTDEQETASVWTIPGGRCDPGEDIQTTLLREIEEETGITDVALKEYWGEFPGAHSGDVVPVFYGTTNQQFKNNEPHKFSEWKWIDLKTIPANFINDEILTLAKNKLGLT